MILLQLLCYPFELDNVIINIIWSMVTFLLIYKWIKYSDDFLNFILNFQFKMSNKKINFLLQYKITDYFKILIFYLNFKNKNNPYIFCSKEKRWQKKKIINLIQLKLALKIIKKKNYLDNWSDNETIRQLSIGLVSSTW